MELDEYFLHHSNITYYDGNKKGLLNVLNYGLCYMYVYLLYVVCLFV